MADAGLYTPSPSSSPSLAPVDSSPPSSPSPLSICTPPASPGVKDPFAGSSKSSKRPRIYERNDAKRALADIQPYTPGHGKVNDASDALTRALDSDDATPTRVVDPFSGSAKRAWRPPTYEKKKERVLSTDSATSASSSTSWYAYGTKRGASPTPASRGIGMSLDNTDDELVLTDEEHERPKLRVQMRVQQETQEALEHRLWDEAITAAIDKGNGVIDLSGTSLSKGPITYIPATMIEDLEGFIVLPPNHNSSSVPSSPQQSSKPLPLHTLSSDHTSSSSRPFLRATTLPAAAFNNNTFLRSKDGERLRGTPAARAASMQTVPPPASGPFKRREIQLFLANNTITRLPTELFRLSSLTVLSLRSNALKVIPPQIAQLTSLQELNVAQNKLRWLPAEMLTMSLKELVVTGNPWIQPPATNIPTSHPPIIGGESTRRPPRPVSDTVVHYTVPPLTEICFRVLFAPYHPHPPSHYTPAPAHTPSDPSSASSHTHSHPASTSSPSNHSTNPASATEAPPTPRPLTVLEAAYALPLTEDLGLGPAVLATFRACVPAAVAKPTAAAQLPGPSKVRRDEGQRDVHSSTSTFPQDVFGSTSAGARRTSPPPSASARGVTRDDEHEPAISVCPSPAHHGQARTPVFVRAAEERFTWEEVVAGVRVGGDGIGGVGVPVRWRGCGHGCLAFLDPAAEPAPIPVPEGDQGGGADVGEVDLDIPVDGDVDADVEMGMSEGGSEVDMQEVRFEGGLADPEDFEEGF